MGATVVHILVSDWYVMLVLNICPFAVMVSPRRAIWWFVTQLFLKHDNEGKTALPCKREPINFSKLPPAEIFWLTFFSI